MDDARIQADRAFLKSCRSAPENFDRPDLVLVQAPCWGTETPPLSLASLSAWLRGKGFKILPLDLNIEAWMCRGEKYESGWRDTEQNRFWSSAESAAAYIADNRALYERWADIIAGVGAKVIGFSVYLSSAYISVTLARMVKARRPDAVIVFGGPQSARYLSASTFVQRAPVDLAVHGEGELTLEDILRRVHAGEPLAGCPGTVAMVDGQIVVGEKRPLIKDLNSLPFLDFTDYHFDCYEAPSKVPMITSRGCINDCNFCSERTLWEKFRGLSGARMFAEIEEQIRRNPAITHIIFHDSLINGRLRELDRFADLLIENKRRVRWSGQAILRRDLTFERMKKYAEAGCRQMAFGLEATSNEVLIRIGKWAMKGADVDQIVRDAHRAGLQCSYNFMFGLPGETDAHFQYTLDFIRRNKDYLPLVTPSHQLCAFLPGTDGYDHPEAFGIKGVESLFFWESIDGTNTFLTRLARFEAFCTLAHELGIPCNYPWPKMQGRERRLGDYYQYKQDWPAAIEWYEAALALTPGDPGLRARLADCRRRAVAESAAPAA